MGKHQREKARAKRAAFKAPSQLNPVVLHVRAPTASTVSASSALSSSSSPHHVDLLRLAFLEWLLPLKQLSSPHELWDRFMTDWSVIPAHELPVQSSRPATLFSHVRALRNSNNMGALRKEVRDGRAKLTRTAAQDEGGLRPHQTLLQWYLDGGESGGAQSEEDRETAHTARSSSDDEVERAEEPRDSEVTPSAAGGSGRVDRTKRRRTVSIAATEQEREGGTSKRRRDDEAEPAATSLLTTNANIWEALADG